MTNSSAVAPRVLVVEDEYLIRMLLEDMLGELGYGVAAAVGTISEARQIATDGHAPDEYRADTALNDRNTMDAIALSRHTQGAAEKRKENEA